MDASEIKAKLAKLGFLTETTRARRGKGNNRRGKEGRRRESEKKAKEREN